MNRSPQTLPAIKISPAAAITVAITAADSLPEPGRALILEHLLSEMRVKTLQVLPREARKEILDQLQAVEAKRQAFVDTYSVVAWESNPQRVRLTFPKGKTLEDLITHANDLMGELYSSKVASPDTIAEWRDDAAFNQPFEEATTITVEGCAANSTGLTRPEQEAQGWCNLEPGELAAAHAAFFIATQKDLLNGLIVRSRDGSWSFNPRGGLKRLNQFSLLLPPDSYGLDGIGACWLIERTTLADRT